MAIILRNTKGSALTYEELDGNFTDLNGRVLDSDGIKALIDADYIQANQADIYRDSAFVTTIVDSDYVNARITAHYNGFDSDFGTKSTTDLSEGTNLYYTSARFDSDLGTKTTTDLTEGTNLYYTTARADSDTQALVDSDYVQNRVTLDGVGLDSSAVLALIDSDYIQAREATAIASVSEDTSPILGGDLDVSANTIKYTFTLTNSGTDHYIFNDPGNNWFPTPAEDPTLYLRRGETYVFNNSVSGAHPFQIQDSAAGTAYNVGVTNNANASGDEVTFTPSMSAPTTLYYRCTNHATMAGTINIV